MKPVACIAKPRSVHSWVARAILAMSFAVLTYAGAPSALAQGRGADRAEPAPRQIIAGVPRSWPPQYGVDASGKPTGFAIDIIPNSGITPELAAKYAFTSPVETFAVAVFVRNDSFDIGGSEDLACRRVAVVEFNVGQRLMQERDDLDRVVYRDAQTALFGLVAGHVEAMVFPEPVLLGLARQVGIVDRIKVVGAPLKELKRGIGVQKHETDRSNQSAQIVACSPIFVAAGKSDCKPV